MALTMAALKRKLVAGTELTLVNTFMGPCRKIRTIERVQGNAIASNQHDPAKIGQLSWLHFNTGDKAEETEKGFRIHTADGGMIEYEWGHNP